MLGIQNEMKTIDKKEILNCLNANNVSDDSYFLVDDSIFIQVKYGGLSTLLIEDDELAAACYNYLKNSGTKLYKSIEEAERDRSFASGQEWIENQKLEFYNSLGPESEEFQCKKEGCERGKIDMSIYCRVHHYENVKGAACPYTH
jgi:hypothetical protein